MKTIALESILADAILWFCENLAELGCPKNEKNPDMWYRYLSSKEQFKVAEKLLDIIDRDTKRFKKDIGFCPKCSRKKMKNKTLVGCRDLTKKQWESGFSIDDNKIFSQKNCPLLVERKNK